jgi:hypothetical protein
VTTYAFTQLVPVTLTTDEPALRAFLASKRGEIEEHCGRPMDWSTMRMTMEDATLVEDWSEEGPAVVGLDIARMVNPDARVTAKLVRFEVDAA